MWRRKFNAWFFIGEKSIIHVINYWLQPQTIYYGHRLDKRQSYSNFRLTALQPRSANFITDESDDEGFVRPKPKPIYFRHTVKPDFKELSTLSSKEYPGSGVKTFSILKVRLLRFGITREFSFTLYEKRWTLLRRRRRRLIWLHWDWGK